MPKDIEATFKYPHVRLEEMGAHGLMQTAATLYHLTLQSVALHSALIKSEKEVENLLKEVGELKSKVSSSSVEQLKAKIASQARTITQLKKEISTKDQTIASLESTIRELRGEIVRGSDLLQQERHRVNGEVDEQVNLSMAQWKLEGQQEFLTSDEFS